MTWSQADIEQAADIMQRKLFDERWEPGDDKEWRDTFAELLRLVEPILCTPDQTRAVLERLREQIVRWRNEPLCQSVTYHDLERWIDRELAALQAAPQNVKGA